VVKCTEEMCSAFIHYVFLSEQFLSELTRMFRKARNHGSVTLTMKRCKFP